MSSADIFCRVVDNFGDIGVCWRLARQLHQQYGYQVRLWVDDLPSFARIYPALNAGLSQQQGEGVWIGHWSADWQPVESAELVIEAFGCELPAAQLVMLRQQPRLVWINLEYLSAEDWIEGCHALPSPQSGLNKWFFFPGFTDKTGGLLREAGLCLAREQFRRELASGDYWQQLSLPPVANDELCISLFCYENSGLEPWLELLVQGPPVRLLVPEGRIVPQIEAWLGEPWRGAMQRGALSLVRLPMTDQQGFDRLLWACDLNLVRGEESLVRAHWAETPFCWHIYPQSEQAHLLKLEAFLQRYLQGLPSEVSAAVHQFWLAWNRQQAVDLAWPGLYAALPALRQHQVDWSVQLQQLGDLAGNLVKFHRARV